jgi:F0F1-type ATP synthase assembly protein I
MVDNVGYPLPPVPPAAQGLWRARWLSPAELRAGALVAGTLALVGAVLGTLWDLWSPAGPLGYVISPGAVVADETEAFVAADGRFAVIALSVGIIAGFVVFFRKATRGPVAVLALAVGGVAGALLTDLVGHALRGGTGDGKANTYINHLPLSVQMHGLLAVEAAVAVLVYGLCVAFAPDDDLGRPDPGAPSEASSVGVGDELQHAGGYADAPGGPQQGQLPFQ